jgi:hypothetical protein
MSSQGHLMVAARNKQLGSLAARKVTPAGHWCMSGRPIGRRVRRAPKTSAGVPIAAVVPSWARPGAPIHYCDHVDGR